MDGLVGSDAGASACVKKETVGACLKFMGRRPYFFCYSSNGREGSSVSLDPSPFSNSFSVHALSALYQRPLASRNEFDDSVYRGSYLGINRKTNSYYPKGTLGSKAFSRPPNASAHSA